MQPAEMGCIPHSRIALWGGERRKAHDQKPESAAQDTSGRDAVGDIGSLPAGMYWTDTEHYAGSLIGCVLALVINVIAGFPGVHFGNLLNMFIRVTGANIGIYISVLPIILLFCCSANNFLGGVALAFVYGYFGTFEGTLLNYYPIKASMILVDPTCGAEYGYTYHIFPAFIIMVLTFLISVRS